MTIEELIVSIAALDSVDRIEIRKDDGYWFVDAVRREGLDGHQQSYQHSSTYLHGALSGLWALLTGEAA